MFCLREILCGAGDIEDKVLSVFSFSASEAGSLF